MTRKLRYWHQLRRTAQTEKRGRLRLGRGGGRFDGRQLTVDHRIDRPCRGFQFSLKPDLDLRGVERVETHLDGVAGQMRRSLVEELVQQEGRVAAYQAVEAMEEETAQIGKRRRLADLLDVALPAQERSRVFGNEVGEELLARRSEKVLNLSAALGFSIQIQRRSFNSSTSAHWSFTLVPTGADRGIPWGDR